MLNWESIEHNHRGYIYRAKVPGGWIVRLYEDNQISDGGLPYINAITHSITFIPDPKHLWDGSSLE